MVLLIEQCTKHLRLTEEVPIEKGANVDFSLIILGYNYQRSGTNDFRLG